MPSIPGATQCGWRLAFITAAIVFWQPCSEVIAADDAKLAQVAAIAATESISSRQKQLRDLQAMNFDAVSAVLSQRNGYEETTSPAFDGASPEVCGSLTSIMHDLRVKKLYLILDGLPMSEAGVKAGLLFDVKLAEYEDNCRKSLAPIPESVYATSAALFLCAEFCCREDFLARADQWIEATSPPAAEIRVDRDLKLPERVMFEVGPLQPRLLLLNLYVQRLERLGCGSAKDLPALTGTKRPATFQKMTFLAWWDGEANSLFSTAQGREAVADAKKLRVERPFAKVWGPAFAGNAEHQRACIDALRKLVEASDQ